jgi:hypothetical protein
VPRQIFAKVVTRGFQGYGGWRPQDRAFLQFTDNALVPGIPKRQRPPGLAAGRPFPRGCDADAFFGTAQDLAALAGLETDVDLNDPGDAKALFGLTWRGKTPGSTSLTIGDAAPATPSVLLNQVAKDAQRTRQQSAAEQNALQDLTASLAGARSPALDLDLLAAKVADLVGKAARPG